MSSPRDVIDVEIPSSKPKIKEGIFFDMPNKEYHEIDGLSSTQFKLLQESIKHYENRKGLYDDEDNTEALLIGCLRHTLLLEPHLIDDYIETTTKTFESEVTKKLIKDNPTKMIVPFGSIELSKKIINKVRLLYSDYLDNAVKECSFIVFDENIKLYRKCRPDIWIPHMGIIIDYKTSKETTRIGFERNSVSQFNYDLQASWYIDTMNIVIEKFNLPYPKIKDFAWIVSPSARPYIPFSALAGKDIIEKGREKYIKETNNYIEVKFNNKFDDIFKEIHTLEYYRSLNN